MLKIRGTHLIKEYWDSEAESQKEKDVSRSLPYYLFHPCIIEEATLGDILRLMEPHLKILSVVINNWVGEFIAELGEIDEVEDTGIDLDYLELVYFAEWEEKEDQLLGNDRPILHGIADGDAYSISFMSVPSLAHLPVKLGGFNINHSIMNDTEWEREIAKFGEASFSLGRILHGVVWELSWYGPPDERDAEWKDLMKVLEEVEEEEEKWKEKK